MYIVLMSKVEKRGHCVSDTTISTATGLTAAVEKWIVGVLRQYAIK